MAQQENGQIRKRAALLLSSPKYLDVSEGLKMYADSMFSMGDASRAITEIVQHTQLGSSPRTDLLFGGLAMLKNKIVGTLATREPLLVSATEITAVRNPLILIAETIHADVAAGTNKHSLHGFLNLYKSIFNTMEFVTTVPSSAFRNGLFVRLAPFFLDVLAKAPMEVGNLAEILQGEGKTPSDFASATHKSVIERLMQNASRQNAAEVYQGVAGYMTNRSQYHVKTLNDRDTKTRNRFADQQQIFATVLNTQQLPHILALTRRQFNDVLQEDIAKQTRVLTAMARMESAYVDLTIPDAKDDLFVHLDPYFALLDDTFIQGYSEYRNHGYYSWNRIDQQRRSDYGMSLKDWKSQRLPVYLMEEKLTFVNGKIPKGLAPSVEAIAPWSVDYTRIGDFFTNLGETLHQGLALYTELQNLGKTEALQYRDKFRNEESFLLFAYLILPNIFKNIKYEDIRTEDVDKVRLLFQIYGMGHSFNTMRQDDQWVDDQKVFSEMAKSL